MPNKENIELWCQALEQEGANQCKSKLKMEVIDTSVQPAQIVWAHCALGVGVEVALAHGLELTVEDSMFVWNASDFIPPIMEFYGMEDSDPLIVIGDEEDTVAGYNDIGVPFWDIAQALRAKYLKDEG